MHIDEDGTFTLSSDHNRLRVDFSSSPWQQPHKERYRTVELVLPASAIDSVAQEFEASGRRKKVTNYGEFIGELKRIIKLHSIRRRSRGGFRRKSWWDAEVKAARDERRLANRTHRRAVKEGDSGEVEKAWEVYLTSKHKLQDLIRSKITEADQRTLKEIRDSGKAAAEKFWRYVNSMDRNDPPPTVIEDHTGNAVRDLAEHPSEYLTKAFEWEDGNTPVADLIRVPSMADTDPVETEQPGSLEQTIMPKWEVVKFALDRAIAHIKNNTARGTDGIPVTLLKCMGDGARRQLASILTDIIAGSPIPEDWMHSRVVLVPKRGGNKKLTASPRGE
ncbi:hypothetical protein HPB47_011716 [Ixodes persulcatus]|uniref:Uncharacterized protein n=1 Tax=Ixodes persulcatus TaxID=34615 RepID=A0AC60NVL6_IXOPE|nr:hypothetical protein HPB47_011716 [Ixodes persulcatus]